jgi:hypothetical protein
MTNSGRIFRCLLAGAAIAAAMGFSEPARAEVSININLGPPVVIAEPPHLVLVPQSQVYFSPDPQVDIFFYGGYWWSPRGDRWYRATEHNGPWGVIERSRVPREVIVVPGDYRTRFEREKPIPYGQWKKQHKQVEKAKHKEQKRDKHDDRGGGGKHGR